VFTDAEVSRVRVAAGRAVAIEATLPPEAMATALAARLATEEQGTAVFPVDRVIAAVPSPVLKRLAPELSPEYVALLDATRYQANMCLLMTLDHPLSHIYWMNISDRSVPFVAVIEHTNLVDRAHYGGRRVVYLSNYIAPDDPFYRAGDHEVLQAYLPHLRRINPAFDASWIREWHVFREDSAQPIITTNYAAKIPPLATSIGGLYLANNTQVYPEDRGQNYSIRIGREVARAAMGDGAASRI